MRICKIHFYPAASSEFVSKLCLLTLVNVNKDADMLEARKIIGSGL